MVRGGQITVLKCGRKERFSGKGMKVQYQTAVLRVFVHYYQRTIGAVGNISKFRIRMGEKTNGEEKKKGLEERLMECARYLQSRNMVKQSMAETPMPTRIY